MRPPHNTLPSWGYIGGGAGGSAPTARGTESLGGPRGLGLSLRFGMGPRPGPGSGPGLGSGAGPGLGSGAGVWDWGLGKPLNARAAGRTHLAARVLMEPVSSMRAARPSWYRDHAMAPPPPLPPPPPALHRGGRSPAPLRLKPRPPPTYSLSHWLRSRAASTTPPPFNHAHSPPLCA